MKNLIIFLCVLILSVSYYSCDKDTDNTQTDTDQDGVIDELDQCANTPTGTEVDEEGCPILLKKCTCYEYTQNSSTTIWDTTYTVNDSYCADLSCSMRGYSNSCYTSENICNQLGVDDSYCCFGKEFYWVNCK